MPDNETRQHLKALPKSRTAKEKIRTVMREFKEGTLHSGSGGTVTNRKQAVAIAIAEARRRRG